MENMLKMRIRWPWVIVVSAIMVTVVLIIYRYHYVLVGSDIYRIDALTGHFCMYPCRTIPPQMYPSQGPTPTPFNIDAYMATQPIKEQLDYARAQGLRKLQARKPMSMSNFGQQTDTTSFRLDYLFHQVLESDDGQLYVVYESCAFVGAGGCDRYHFGTLDGNRLMEIWLPHDRGEWGEMVLLATSTPSAPVVRATQREGPAAPHQYRVSKHDIIQVPVTKDDDLSTQIDHRLASGETCRLERSRSSAAFVNATDPSGHTRALVSKSEFLAETENLVELSDPDLAYCTHFQDVDMLVVGYGDSQVTFVVMRGRLWLASPASPFAITRHHLVLFTNVVDEQGALSGGTWDYVNVTRKRP